MTKPKQLLIVVAVSIACISSLPAFAQTQKFRGINWAYKLGGSQWQRRKEHSGAAQRFEYVDERVCGGSEGDGNNQCGAGE
jgi:hypothetical protein